MSVAGVLVLLCLIGAFQGIFLALALVSAERGNKLANRLLAAFVLAASIVIVGGVIRSQGYLLDFPHLSRVHHPFSFLLGPLLFLYLATLVRRQRTFAKKNYLHFLPFAACIAYLLPYYFQSTAGKLESIEADRVAGSSGQWLQIRSTVLIVQFFVYLVASAVLLARLRKVERKEAVLNLSERFQIRYLLVSCAILWIFGVLQYVFIPPGTALLPTLGGAVIVYGLGYLRLAKPEVVGEPENVAPPGLKYEGSTLSPEKSERYLNRLIEIMESEKLYTDCDLSLAKVAERLSISPHHLSQIVNERLNQSFSDFINTYRVNEVKSKLLDPSKKHLSILAIAEEAGFNSKSAFNSVFKKHTNITPSEFRENGSNGGKPTIG